jgi:hypothetical protein
MYELGEVGLWPNLSEAERWYLSFAKTLSGAANLCPTWPYEVLARDT